MSLEFEVCEDGNIRAFCHWPTPHSDQHALEIVKLYTRLVNVVCKRDAIGAVHNAIAIRGAKDPSDISVPIHNLINNNLDDNENLDDPVVDPIEVFSHHDKS